MLLEFCGNSPMGSLSRGSQKCTSDEKSIPHFVSLEVYRRARYLVTERLRSSWAPVNQRQHNRYRLAASVTFSWETEDDRVHYGKGQTRDCSLSGAFVISPERLTIGSTLQMEFSLPRLLAAGPGARL